MIYGYARCSTNEKLQDIKENRKMNAIIYARHADKSIVSEQLDFCRQYAKDNGILVVGEYIENTNNQDMEELNKIVKNSASGNFNAIIIYTFDRLGRNCLKVLNTISTLKNNNITIIVARENMTQQQKEMSTKNCDNLNERYIKFLCKSVPLTMP